ncbi:MAG: transcription termination factor NusA [Ignavibacteriota bacterium]|nr:transcription termination factor NusA [Ignavibacteriota bacterium]
MKSDIVEAFVQMAKMKSIDRDILESVIKDSFRKMMEKKHGPTANFDIIVNMEKGNIEIFLYKTVVEDVVDPATEIDIETAKDKSGEDFEVGDDFVEEIPIEEFGRRSVLNLKQSLNQKLREIDKEVTYNFYKDQLGEILVGEVYQIKPASILLMHNGNELFFPKEEQIAKERYKKGDNIRVIIKRLDKKPSGPPLIVVSRADDKFLYKLFELEIPEIYDGILEIKGISRDPGERAKIAVMSNDDKIDAVGACVGMKGMRIHSIVRELCNENIDVINYTKDNALYISRALSPAKLQDIYIDNVNKVAKINADEDQVSLIIGKNGQNIKLASKLTGFQIDVIREQNDEDEDEDEDENNENNENMNEENDENMIEENDENTNEENESSENVTEETTDETQDSNPEAEASSENDKQ